MHHAIPQIAQIHVIFHAALMHDLTVYATLNQTICEKKKTPASNYNTEYCYPAFPTQSNLLSTFAEKYGAVIVS